MKFQMKHIAIYENDIQLNIIIFWLANLLKIK